MSPLIAVAGVTADLHGRSGPVPAEAHAARRQRRRSRRWSAARFWASSASPAAGSPRCPHDLGLLPPTAGSVALEGVDIRTLGRKAWRARVQPVFQDPYSSLKPAAGGVASIVALPLRSTASAPRGARKQR
jgi:hypothetical protein